MVFCGGIKYEQDFQLPACPVIENSGDVGIFNLEKTARIVAMLAICLAAIIQFNGR